MRPLWSALRERGALLARDREAAEAIRQAAGPGAEVHEYRRWEDGAFRMVGYVVTVRHAVPLHQLIPIVNEAAHGSAQGE